MKAFKKFFALLLALLMTMSLLVTTAMADDPPAVKYDTNKNYQIVIQNSVEGHIYKAYQIFKGTLDTKGVLSDITWGDGVNSDALLAALKNKDYISANYPDLLNNDNNPFASATTAKDVVDVMANGWSYYEKEIMAFSDLLNGSVTIEGTTSPILVAANAFAHSTYDADKKEYVITGTDSHKLTTGYYLIVDTWNDVSDAFNDAPADGVSDYMLLLNRPNDPTDNGGTRCVITPKVSAPTFTKTVHSSVDGTYGKFVDSEISDMSLENIKDGSGNVESAKLTALGASNTVWFKLEATMPSLIKNYKQYHVVFTDELPACLKPVSGSSTGNIYLLHGTGEKTDLVNTDITVTQDGGKYKVVLDLGDILPVLKAKNFNLNDTIVIKYAATLKPGATFGTANANINTATMYYSNDMNQTVVETGVHSTFNHTDLKVGMLTSSASVYTYQATFTKIDSVTSTPLAGAEFHLFRNRTDSTGQTTAYYAKFDSDGYISDWTTDKDAAGTLRSGNDGTFVVKGLDSMSYHLEETVAPAGYDKMKQPVTFTIETTKDSTLALTGLSMTTDGTKVVGELQPGTVTGVVRNTPGKVLPATGGMGTTIFYIVGGVLVLGAAAAFVMKRREA